MPARAKAKLFLNGAAEMQLDLALASVLAVHMESTVTATKTAREWNIPARTHKQGKLKP